MAQPLNDERLSLPYPTVARRIREAAGWSRQRMADELGVHVQTLIGWELGEGIPSRNNIWPYAALLDRLNRVGTGGDE
jgi:transcriptional regulator with XRE-family HTH domain